MTDIAAVMAVGYASFPEVISISTQSARSSALPIRKDELGIDIMITGTQKALALPPACRSARLAKRARRVPPP